MEIDDRLIAEARRVLGTSSIQDTIQCALREVAQEAARREGGDTGPLHLAAACRTPVVGIFGPTDPGRNGSPHPEDLAVFQPVPCGPCYKRTCRKYRRQCMTLVTVDQVFDAVVRRLEQPRVQASLPPRSN